MKWAPVVWMTMIAIITIMILGTFTVLVVDKSYHHYQEEHAKKEQTTRVWPPAIPSCEKELWDRIRGECDERPD